MGNPKNWPNPSVPVAISEIQNHFHKNLMMATHAPRLVISMNALEGWDNQKLNIEGGRGLENGFSDFQLLNREILGKYREIVQNQPFDRFEPLNCIFMPISSLDSKKAMPVTFYSKFGVSKNCPLTGGPLGPKNRHFLSFLSLEHKFSSMEHLTYHFWW